MTASVLRHYRVWVLVTAAVVFDGVWTFVTLPRTEDPEFETASCAVSTLWPGVAADAVEDLVTRPLEDAIREVGGIRRVKSTSSAGLSLIAIHFTGESTPADVVAEIRDTLEESRGDLPEGVRKPEVLEFSPASIPVIVAALQGPQDYALLQAWAERLEQKLAALDGVAEVEIEGLPERQIRVRVDHERLFEYGIPLTRVSDILARENAGVPGGELDVGMRRLLLPSSNRYESMEEIERTVVGTAGDSVISLGSVAEIVDGFAEATYVTRTNRRTAVLLSVTKRERTNAVAVAETVRSAIAAFRTGLPEDLDVTVISDRGLNVEEQLAGLQLNAVGGGFLVVILTSLFLGIRQAAAVCVAIPLSVMVALIALDASSVDLNQVSIFGLVLALGMLVDSALVVVESVALRLEDGDAAFGAVVEGVEQVKVPVISSALTTVAAFAPMLVLEGDAGAFVRGLPLSVIYSLLASVAVALTVVPLLCYGMWRTSPVEKQARDPLDALAEAYLELAKRALRNRGATLALAVGAFVIAVAAIPRLGIEYFPRADKRFFLINVRLPNDVNLETTRLVAEQVEDLLAAEPAVRDFTANLGKGSPRIYYNEIRESESESYAQFLVNLSDEFTGPVGPWVAALQEKLRRISGATVEPRLLQQGPAAAAAIELRVRGDDLETLAGLAREIRDRIADVPGVRDLRDSLGGTVPRLTIELDDAKAALLGVDSYDFSRTVLIASSGLVASRYRGEDEQVPIVVGLEDGALDEVSQLNRLRLPSDRGGMVPFSEVATVADGETFARLEREAGRRQITVMSDVGGRLTEDVTTDIRQRLSDLALPAGYELVYGGEQEEREASFAGLGQALVLASLLIYGILAVQFNSFAQPFVILLTVPFGLVGAVVGLFVTGNPFGFMAFVGVVSLTGIVINDSIVLTDHANYLQRVEGQGLYQSVLGAVRRRFRPVVLTSVTTIGGMTPLAIWGGSVWSPLATALIFGLAGATVLILVVLPVIYSLLVARRDRRRTHRLAPTLWARLVRAEPAPRR